MADPEQTGASGPPAEPSDTADNVHDLGRDTGAQRLRRLQIEAHRLAREQVEILTQDLNAISPAGGRDLRRRRLLSGRCSRAVL